MSVKNRFMFKRFFIYGSIGISLEILWTGFTAFLSGDMSFTGHSSVIMLPIYGSAVFLEPLFTQLKNVSVILRGIVYMILIFAVEYWSGLILTFFEICPWSYLNAALNIRGLIRLDYAPLWFTVGLLYEHLYKKLPEIISHK